MGLVGIESLIDENSFQIGAERIYAAVERGRIESHFTRGRLRDAIADSLSAALEENGGGDFALAEITDQQLAIRRLFSGDGEARGGDSAIEEELIVLLTRRRVDAQRRS